MEVEIEIKIEVEIEVEIEIEIEGNRLVADGRVPCGGIEP